MAGMALAGCGSSVTANGTPTQQTTHHGIPSISYTRDLQPQLLTVAEIPTGWAIDNSAKVKGTTPPCIAQVNAKSHATSKAEVSFEKGTGLPFFKETLAYYGTGTTATSALRSGVNALNKCNGISFKANGYTYSGSMGSMAFPKVGQASAAWRIVLSSEGYTFGLDLVAAQKGPEVMLLTYGDFGTPDITAITSLVKKAVSKMPLS